MSKGIYGAVRITFVCDVIPVVIDAVTTDPSPLCLDQEGEVTVNFTNNSGSPITGINYTLQYSLSPSGPWSDIATNITSVPTLGASYTFNFTPTTTGNTIIYYRLMDGSTLVNAKITGINTVNCNPPADSDCENATVIETNSTYIGNTGDFDPIANPNGHWLTSGSDYTIENIGYYQFIANETSIEFEACTSCTSGFGGIQFYIFEECGNGNSVIGRLRQLSVNSGSINTTGNFTNTGNANGCSIFTFSGLTIGNTYYWGVDGFEGDDCPYTIRFNDGISVLPIELISFTGNAISKGNLVEWITGSERNNDYFTVLSSRDGFLWKEIAEVQGAGNSKSVLSYEFLDRQANPGVTYYKLKQTDYDGSPEELDVISVLRSIENGIVIYPNPSKGTFKLAYHSAQNKDLSLHVYDMLGQVIYQSTESLEKGVNTIPIELKNTKKGFYILKIELDGSIESYKIVIE